VGPAGSPVELERGHARGKLVVNAEGTLRTRTPPVSESVSTLEVGVGRFRADRRAATSPFDIEAWCEVTTGVAFSAESHPTASRNLFEEERSRISDSSLSGWIRSRAPR
jgi:hypothetical protein